MTSVSWLGRGGTADAPRGGNANDAGSWSSGSIPDNQQSIDLAPGNYTVVDNIENWHVQRMNIDVGATLVAKKDIVLDDVSGGLPPSDISGTLKLRGATLFTARDMTGAGTISGFGTINEDFIGLDGGPSPINLRAIGGTLTVNVSSIASISGHLSGSGTIAFVGNGYGQAILDMGTVTVATLRIDGGENMQVGIGQPFVDRGGFELDSGQLFTLGSLMVLAGTNTLAGGGIYAYGRHPTGTLALRADTTITNQFNTDNILIPHNGGAVTQSGTLTIHAATANEGPPAHFVNMQSGTWSLVDGGSILTDACVGTFHNHGVLAKTGNGTSTVALTVENNGTVDVSSGMLALEADLTGTGTIAISGGATLEVGAGVASTQTVAFTGAGALLIDDAEAFAATVAGFGAGDTIGLADLAATGATLAFAYASRSDHTHGTLRVSSGSISAALAFDGHFIVSGFHLAADGAGASLTYMSHSSASSTLVGTAA